MSESGLKAGFCDYLECAVSLVSVRFCARRKAQKFGLDVEELSTVGTTVCSVVSI